MEDDKSARMCEAARMKVLERILEFIKTDNGAPVLEIRLAGTDQEAKAEGWPSTESQRLSLTETLQALPVDVARRIKLVPK